jgi:hypothetical protein
MADDLPMPTARPPSTESLDADLAGTLKRFHRLRWILVSVTGGLLVVALVVFGILLYRQERAIQATCSFYGDIARVDIKPVPPLRRPSKLTVTLVSHTRTAYEGLHCSPALPPPSAELEHWAAVYRIEIP